MHLDMSYQMRSAVHVQSSQKPMSSHHLPDHLLQLAYEVQACLMPGILNQMIVGFGGSRHEPNATRDGNVLKLKMCVLCIL